MVFMAMKKSLGKFNRILVFIFNCYLSRSNLPEVQMASSRGVSEPVLCI